MENKDKIYEQFKEAAENAEQKGFDRMEAVWNRVEEKLNKKKKRRGIVWWKYTGAAALLLLFISIGNMIMRNNPDPLINPDTLHKNNITLIDTQKVNEVFNPSVKEVVEEEIVVEGQKSPITNQYKIGDTIHYENGSYAVILPGNKMRVWESRSERKFRVTGDITYRDSDGPASEAKHKSEQGVAYNKKAEFSTSKDAENPEYYFYSNKIKLVPGSKNDTKSESNVSRSQRDLGNEAAEPDQSEETVVTGYGAEKQSSATGAVTTISAEKVSKASISNTATINPNTTNQYPAVTANRYPINANTKARATRSDEYRDGDVVAEAEILEDRANASILQSLQGQVAGLNIATGSGQPDADTTIVLRGTGSINGNVEPLFIIDSIPVDEDGLRSLNQNDIASFNVLKDAAATSIYGNRGANGVIVITTKRGLSKKELRKLKRKWKKQEKERKKLQKNNSKTSKEQVPFHKAEPQGKIQIDQEDYESFEENQFENPAIAPLSTFSIDVDNASYTNVRRFLNNGQTVPKDAVRVEEMINFFKYQYPQPTGNDIFSINTEYSDAPWNPKHKLLKIGLKGKDIPTDNLPASNFVFLIDVSGSMESSNKLPLLKQSMKLLVNQMRAQDRIAIVVYAGAAGLVLPSTSGAEKSKITAALDNLSAGGSTAGGAGIELAYKTAQEYFIKGGNNRVILATDGDFNVGSSSNSDMQTLIEAKRKSGVFLTCLGYGMGNYKDSKMEILADKGNGNYAYIDNMQEADRFLQKEFKGSMFAIAKDVKIQIEFNPKYVQSYRLIGYENRKLRDEDFANDAIDAGELGSGHTVTALYEIIPVGVESDYFTPATELKYSQPTKASGDYSDELATIKFRHKKPDEDVSKETIKVIPNISTALSNTSGDFKFAASVAWFGLKLRDSELIPNKQTEAILKLAKDGLQNDPQGYRSEFVRLVKMVE